jgi:predicted nucleic acid-binding protein
LTDHPVVADAGPLIGLARVGLLGLLYQLYGKILIPVQVLEELQITEARPGSVVLRAAIQAGWLQSALVTSDEELKSLSLALGPGEAGAILLAEQRPCRFLLLDERRGRAVAKRRGLRIVGTGGVLLTAKQQGLLDRVSVVLDQLAESGYRLSPELRNRILSLAGEGETP